MAKNKEGKIPKRTGQLHEALDGMEMQKLHPDTQSELNAMMLLDRAIQYSAQKAALSPDKPNLSPNEIDTMKALIGF
ncbi:MAG TPA: hypothetical protein VKF36_22515 [Syntrophorhabdales bacterium]|nr:hypothetical protein [Syntrophorhabdales bacterium]